MSGNTITLLEPPEDDPVSTLYSSHWLGMFFEILMQVLSIHICVWQGEGTSAALGMSILWKYPAYVVHKV